MIRLDHIAKSFGGVPVLEDVSLEIVSGQSLAILGRSGTGKSVLARIALGLMAADAGQVMIDGAPMSAKVRRGLMTQTGVLFQGAALFDSLPVWENVAFRLRHGPKRVRRRAAKDAALEALDKVGLDARVADLLPSDLSGGMQKRVGLARAILGRPRLLIFDEPNSGLDPVTAGEIDALIRSLVTDLGAAAMTITHDMASIRAIADEVFLLDAGRARWQGPVEDLDGAKDPLLARFLSR
ncbi:ABC transporter ATP-binding protein [Maritimibacter dapengensis]|uniref:ATP-binding cassette domain-containing protein n=1 Tax=Maritimibacter dapengensis TaxID=2836868 RepID=A0ABS6T1X1_9RHOB|nr:ATP-binding cassette domain-containing protein [Maritimibacter dapengensis]MBV7379240.1 ATP-binding cassette domain-containing protein [Maritimibacter dapengensis]